MTEVRLLGVGADTLRALYEGRPDWTSLETGVRPIEWPSDDRRMLRYRMNALAADPACEPYLLHLVLGADGTLLGRIGCHEAPDAAGEVEIGYYVRPSERGKGVAGRAVDLFLEWLCGVGVRSVRASVGPGNAASRHILTARGFVETGRQIDDEDGEEIIYTRSLSA
jgi:RimJ/RimL family protein N-acetyltransferase